MEEANAAVTNRVEKGERWDTKEELAEGRIWGDITKNHLAEAEADAERIRGRAGGGRENIGKHLGEGLITLPPTLLGSQPSPKTPNS